MQFFAKLSVAAAFASSIIGAFAAPTNGTLSTRALAQVITSCTVPNTVALTFDDVSLLRLSGCALANTFLRGHTHVRSTSVPLFSRLTPILLDIYDISKALVAAGAKGAENQKYAFWIFSAPFDTHIFLRRVKYAYDKGHQIGSHTWAHKDLSTHPQLTWDQVHDEMWRVEQALQRIVGVTPAFMRPPYGNYNDNVRSVASARGQKIAIWDFDSGDSVGATPAQSKADYDGIISQHPSTILALNHETYERTAYVELANIALQDANMKPLQA
ncbi:carbohydrate esterase family 4 protein [Rhizoctonia solani AG-1 IA]|uniref:Carbohydrate esterase family 4 protein n=1 Tax=Thanatephorus cucumeris (strain AG1-IA) TaxID=983506 RepID=L8WPX5_THACA|nr:carbohydrate esterase family 4 protein [Rhizoctonia solani AG-1 IA]